MIFYVYFDNETREIVSITNEKIESNHSYVEKQRNDVEDFIQGRKNFVDFKFDSRFNFVVKNKQTKDVVTNTFVEIKTKINPMLNVTHNNCWQFSFAKPNQSINGDLFFAVTEKNNPNKLIRTIHFNSQLANSVYEVDFKYNSEKSIKNISIWAINPPYESAGLQTK